MKIAVLVKQVPAVDTVKIDESTGTMIRDGVEAELNPLDLHAVESAVCIKESRPEGETEITALTMGPPQAKKTLLYAIAMGCDKGVLISDRKFGGADTLATARTIAAALEKEGPFDLIFAGELPPWHALLWKTACSRSPTASNSCWQQLTAPGC